MSEPTRFTDRKSTCLDPVYVKLRDTCINRVESVVKTSLCLGFRQHEAGASSDSNRSKSYTIDYDKLNSRLSDQDWSKCLTGLS